MGKATQKRGSAILASGLVLVAAGVFVFYGAALRKGPVAGGQTLHAHFNSANGLRVGADVDLAGVTVGRVRSIRLDPGSQMADVTFTVGGKLHLPVDTSAGIGAPTMTSDNALILHPGQNKALLAEGGLIRDTQDQLSLEQQVSNYIFGNGKLGP